MLTCEGPIMATSGGVLRVEREHTESIYGFLICPPVIRQTLRSLDHLSLTKFSSGADFEQVW